MRKLVNAIKNFFKRKKRTAFGNSDNAKSVKRMLNTK